MKGAAANSPVLLYDGVCGFCNKTVQMILDQDHEGRMLFAALQSKYGRGVVARHPSLEEVDSVVLLERTKEGEEHIFVRSAAALRVAKYLGGVWKLFLIFYLVPTPVRDFFYNLMARYRYKFFGKYDACMLPPPEVRARFLDM